MAGQKGLQAAQQTLSIQNALSQILANSSDLAEAMPAILKTVSEGLGWEVCGFWIVDPITEVLRCKGIWHSPDLELPGFELLSEQLVLPKGVGLPGRVWASAQPVWINNIEYEANFPRALAAIQEDLHGAFGFPVQVGRETLGVLELFSREIQVFNEQFVHIVSGVCLQIAQFIKHTEQFASIRRSDALKAAILESSFDSVICFDARMKIVEFNSAAERVFGRFRASAIGRDFIDLLIPPQRRRDLREEIQRSISTNPEIGIHLLQRSGMRVDTTEFPIEISIRSANWEGVQIFTAFIRDVTEQVRSQRAIHFLMEVDRILSSTLDYEKTMKSIADLSVPRLAEFCLIDICDEQGRIRPIALRHIDPELETRIEKRRNERSLEIKDEHPISRAIRNLESNLMPRIDHAILDELIRNSAEPDLLEAIDPVSAMIVPLKLRDRALGAISLVKCKSPKLFDFHDLELAEDMAKRAAGALEKAQLYRKLEQALQIRDELLAVVSHDLKNPLTVILSTATSAYSLLAPAEAQSRTGRCLKLIENSVYQMTSLISDLQDLAMIEAKVFAPKKTPVDAKAVIEEMRETFQHPAGEKSIVVEAEFPKEPITVLGDRRRLIQVFSNLIGNALKFSTSGGRILLSARVADPFLEFCVSDQGPGIATENIPHIFDRFWKGTKVEDGGAGLGLFISKNIVEAFGGSIWAESAPGVGSRFYFTLPLFQNNLPSGKPIENPKDR